ncbi:MAG: hypothetical protein ACYDA7_09760 [Acidithiobacillus sp.]
MRFHEEGEWIIVALSDAANFVTKGLKSRWLGQYQLPPPPPEKMPVKPGATAQSTKKKNYHAICR